jgi:thymidylate synthase (FAD)
MIETHGESTVELIKHNASDEDVAYAAWVSNFGKDAQARDTSDLSKLINFLYSNRHMSPFEHGSFTFFVDTPLFVAREFMRHRTFSYNETSGRYKEMDGRFYVPSAERPLIQAGKVGAYTFKQGTQEQHDLVVACFMESFEVAWTRYQIMLENGIAKEVARDVLPLSLYTQFYATANPRNIMQFLVLRNDKHALWEIRKVAEVIEQEFAQAMPLTYNAFISARDREASVETQLKIVEAERDALGTQLLELQAAVVEIKQASVPTTLHTMKRKGGIFR